MEEVIKYKWEAYYIGNDGKEHCIASYKEYTDEDKCDKDLCDKCSDLEEAGYSGVSGDIFTYEYGVWRAGR